MRRALLAALFASLLLAGCDDAITQPKLPAYRSAAVGPGKVPLGRVEAGQRPVPPPPLRPALVQRGQDQFRQFCTPCHSELGDGHGMVVQRGFSPPPSYMEPRLVQGPTQHFYDVQTNGYGAMYSFADRVRPADRWAIAAYIRALQRSNDAAPADLPAMEREKLVTARQEASH
jgi:mono/diheme cytochrome c family protein